MCFNNSLLFKPLSLLATARGTHDTFTLKRMLEIYIHRPVPFSPYPGLAYLSSFLSLGHNQFYVPQAPLFETVKVTSDGGVQTSTSHAGF